MGLLFGKLMKKKSAVEELEYIDKEMKSLESSQKDAELTRKRIVGYFVLFSVIVYVLVAFLFYFFFFPASFYDRLFYILPLIIAPLLIIILKKAMAWYYNRKITKAQTKLSKLKEDKKKLIDKVMETETYKVAKQILDKYAPDQNKKTNSSSSSALTSTGGGLRYRPVVGKEVQPSSALTTIKPNFSLNTPLKPNQVPVMNTPMLRPTVSHLPTSTMPNKIMESSHMVRPSIINQTPANVPSNIPFTPAIPTPKSIFPKDRSVLDKMVDFLVGDGPSNRYALLCQFCYGHNGMALREEAKYTAFRCCYCYAFNPAMVKKPLAPKLEFDKSLSTKLRRLSNTESDKSETSESDENETNNDDNGKINTQDNSKHDLEKSKSTFSELQRNFTEIESTIAEIKKAELEAVETHKNSDVEFEKDQTMDHSGPENEATSFEFVNVAETSTKDEEETDACLKDHDENSEQKIVTVSSSSHNQD